MPGYEVASRGHFFLLLAAHHAVKVGIRVSAGHGLTYENITRVLYARALEQVIVGRALFARSRSVGFAKAVEEMLEILD